MPSSPLETSPPVPVYADYRQQRFQMPIFKPRRAAALLTKKPPPAPEPANVRTQTPAAAADVASSSKVGSPSTARTSSPPPRNSSLSTRTIPSTIATSNSAVSLLDDDGDSKSVATTASRPRGSRSIPSRPLRSTHNLASPPTQQQFLQVPGLVPLQSERPDNSDAHLIQPLTEDDPQSFDLVPPEKEPSSRGYNIEERADLLLSKHHLRVIFDDPRLLKTFISFINTYRTGSVDRLTIYRQAKKAIQAIKYSNAVAAAMSPVPGHDFTQETIPPTHSALLEKLAEDAFEELVCKDLPAYVCSVWIPIISATVHQRINGALPGHLKQASEGLAEVFCLTDPRRQDEPIVLASKEFTTTTQYGLNFVCGQNCRFLQGSGTDPKAVQRIREALKAEREHSEILLNYRRDGSPFMNLLMLVPLTDLQGNLKYFLGAQVDVSGLLKSCAGFESFARTVREDQDDKDETSIRAEEDGAKDFQGLAELFTGEELKTVRVHGGAMYREGEMGYPDDDDDSASLHTISNRPRMTLVDPNERQWTNRDMTAQEPFRGGRVRDSASQHSTHDRGSAHVTRQLETMYKDFVLVRPAPSFTITFTSSSLFDEDLVQTNFFKHVGGSTRVRDGLLDALSEGHKVTAKVRWKSQYRRKDDKARVQADPIQTITASNNGFEGDGQEGFWITRDHDKRKETKEIIEEAGALRWIHCTPLIGGDGKIGVWVIMLIDA